MVCFFVAFSKSSSQRKYGTAAFLKKINPFLPFDYEVMYFSSILNLKAKIIDSN